MSITVCSKTFEKRENRIKIKSDSERRLFKENSKYCEGYFQGID